MIPKPDSSSSPFVHTKKPVLNRGVPPDSFLRELVAWGHDAPDEIFALNRDPDDVYGLVRSILGPWEGEPGSKQWFLHRKAVMLEIQRCLAGLESSWRWLEGVDKTNQHSLSHKIGEEAGIFQVSEDSENLDGPATDLRDCVIRYCGTNDVQAFIDTMKVDHTFALEYCARLLRFSTRWDGPINRRELHPNLSRAAVNEFQQMIAT